MINGKALRKRYERLSGLNIRPVWVFRACAVNFTSCSPHINQGAVQAESAAASLWPGSVQSLLSHSSQTLPPIWEATVLCRI